MGTNDIVLLAEMCILEYERVNAELQEQIKTLALKVDLLKPQLQTVHQFTTQHILGLHEARVCDQASVKLALQRLHESHKLTAAQEQTINQKFNEILLILGNSKANEDTQVFDQFISIPPSSQEESSVRESLKRPNEDPGNEEEPSKRARFDWLQGLVSYINQPSWTVTSPHFILFYFILFMCI